MDALIGNYSFDLIAFYSFMLTSFFVVVYLKTRKFLFATLISLLVTLVGSEYYELSIFVMAYVKGIADFPFGEIHHVIVASMFVMLMKLSKVKFTKKNIFLLVCGPLLATPFLFVKIPYLVPLTRLYLARSIGFAFLWTVIINSPGVGGKKASSKPNKTKSTTER